MLTTCGLGFISVFIALVTLVASYNFYKYIILKIKGEYFFQYSWPDIVAFSMSTAMFVGLLFYSQVSNHVKVADCTSNVATIVACK